MAKRATLVHVGLVHENNGRELILEMEAIPIDGRIRVRVVQWLPGQLEYIERHLAAANTPIIHEGEQSHFWLPTSDVMQAIKLTEEAFGDHYAFEEPVLWYYTPDEGREQIELILHLGEGDGVMEVTIECPPWGNASKSECDKYERRLLQSGLCVTGSVSHTDIPFNRFHMILTEEATKQPLQTFDQLVNLHPALG